MNTAARTLVIGLVTLLASTAHAQGNWRPGDDGQVRFRLGLFEPDGSSDDAGSACALDPTAGPCDSWYLLYEGFTGDPSDLRDVVWGFEYGHKMTRQSGFLFGTSFYSGSATSAYRDWVDADGNEIRHTKRLRINDLYVLYALELGSPYWVVTPYVAAGGGLLWYRIEESGRFIDFGVEDLPVFSATYADSGTTFEALGVVGFDIRLGWKWSLFAEGRWRWAEVDLGNDYDERFRDFDLSGLEIGAGFAYKF